MCVCVYMCVCVDQEPQRPSTTAQKHHSSQELQRPNTIGARHHDDQPLLGPSTTAGPRARAAKRHNCYEWT